MEHESNLPVTKPTFMTGRLNVFQFRILIHDEEFEKPHHLYVAFEREDFCREPIATAVVDATPILTTSPHSRREEYFVEWLEVPERYRRQGYGRELMEAVESRTPGRLVHSAGTKDGAAFINAHRPHP